MILIDNTIGALISDKALLEGAAAQAIFQDMPVAAINFPR